MGSNPVTNESSLTFTDLSTYWVTRSHNELSISHLESRATIEAVVIPLLKLADKLLLGLVDRLLD